MSVSRLLGPIADHYAAGPALTNYDVAVLADSPLGYWKLDEASGTTMADSSGNHHDGIYGTSVLLNQAPLLPFGSSASAKGGNTSYGIGHVASDISWMNPTSFSVEFWFKPNNTADIGGVVSRYTGGFGSRMWLFWQRSSGPRLDFLIQDTASGDHALAGPTYTVGSVYYIVGTYDGTTQKIYVNGSLNNSQAVSLSGSSSADMQIGSYGGTGNFSQATVDNVAFYSGALSATRIGAHYTAGTTP